jgi:hypothetical protein
MADKDEPTWWAGIQSTAEDAVGFWNAFLGLRKGASHNQVLGATDLAKLVRIVRAVSWVESKHGHGGGSSAVDPMQCGNPGDSWWKTITGQSGKGDRFVRGPGLSNLDAKDLPAEAAKDAAFPAGAKMSSLTKPTDGHNDAKFSNVTSFFWGVPYLIHRTNTTAGDKTFQCVDLNDTRLINGAVAYNGGGDPNYRMKIEKALALIDTPVFALIEEAFIGSGDVATNTGKLFAGLMANVRSEERLQVFPYGLTSIQFKVEVGSFKAELTLSGPSGKTTETSDSNA